MKIGRWYIGEDQTPKIEELSKGMKGLQKKFSNLPTDFYGFGYGGDIMYTGQKNLGELPMLPKYFIDHYILASNAWRMYLSSDVAQTITTKVVNQAIGTGLKLQFEPNADALEAMGRTAPPDELKTNIESQFNVWSNSVYSDYNKRECFNKQQSTVTLASTVAGDSVVILRNNKGIPTVQVVDTENLNGFVKGNDGVKRDVIDGVEYNAQGVAIAYHIINDKGESQRITALDPVLGVERAFLIKSPLRYRQDDRRGVSMLAAVLERVSKLDRYIEAAVGNAEENAKQVNTFEADKDAIDEDVMNDGKKLVGGIGARHNTVVSDAPTEGELLAVAGKDIFTSFNKSVRQLPKGWEYKTHEAKAVNQVPEFFDFNYNVICGVFHCPPEVARAMFNSNYTASRAAIETWGKTVDTLYRHNISTQLNEKVFKYWLAVMVAEDKVDYMPYLDAVLSGDRMLAEAYSNTLWSGAKQPQVDPLKEVKAVREMLGAKYANVPLGTLSRALADLGGGDVRMTYERLLKETDKLTDIMAKLEEITPEPPQGGNGGGGGEANAKLDEILEMLGR